MWIPCITQQYCIWDLHVYPMYHQLKANTHTQVVFTHKHLRVRVTQCYRAINLSYLCHREAVIGYHIIGYHIVGKYIITVYIIHYGV